MKFSISYNNFNSGELIFGENNYQINPTTDLLLQLKSEKDYMNALKTTSEKIFFKNQYQQKEFNISQGLYISITNLKSVAALFFMPLAWCIIILMVVCTVYIIILCKRSCITEDPHDNIRKRHETILRICNQRIAEYRDEMNRLQMKILNFKSGKDG